MNINGIDENIILLVLDIYSLFSLYHLPEHQLGCILVRATVELSTGSLF